MHIAHVIDTLKIGGAQRLLEVFASQAQIHGLQMTVISLSVDHDMTIIQALREEGVGVVSFPAPKLLTPGRFWRLIRYLRQGRFDLVHTHLTYANIIGTLAGRLTGIPTISTLHSTGHSMHRFHPVVEGLERWLLRLGSSRVIAVGQTVAESYHPQLGNKEIVVIPNAVPMPADITPAERLAMRREIAGDPDRPILISVGRFIPAKAYEDLITAFASVHRSHPEAVLAIIGDGPLLANIQAQVCSQDLEAHVILPGRQSDVNRWLTASDLYISSSKWEGLPLTLLEAMMAGLPIVATQVGDVPLVVTPEIGLVVPYGQPGQLADAVNLLLADPDRCGRMGEAGRSIATTKYTVNGFMESHISLYHGLLDHPKPSNQAKGWVS